tara:strand:- start:303 stop:452 length:150 start_codon:yes stop_codon:yes gene_type:complete
MVVVTPVVAMTKLKIGVVVVLQDVGHAHGHVVENGYRGILVKVGSNWRY